MSRQREADRKVRRICRRFQEDLRSLTTDELAMLSVAEGCHLIGMISEILVPITMMAHVQVAREKQEGKDVR